jgi:queuine tRNA-ribosyltransferase
VVGGCEDRKKRAFQPRAHRGRNSFSENVNPPNLRLTAGNAMHFRETHRDGDARCGVLNTAHGPIETPIFMPVGTRASVKTVSPQELKTLEASIILGNTYHLNLRPGMGIIDAAGGLHPFMSWDRPILTDSGGYQVFSLSKLRKVTEAGVQFRSHIDGAKLFLGPREAMDIQRRLGSDIAMVFDECPPYPSPEPEVARSLERTLRWAMTCREQARSQGQLVFGIGQGGGYRELRERCMASLVEMDFDGYAIGGLSVGEPEATMYEILEWVVPIMPPSKARYLMGVGTPPQLVEAVARGVDMFDCVLPTRVARNGSAYTSEGMLQAKAGRWKADFRPIQEDCECYTCTNFTRAYVRHLLNVGEIFGLRLVTLHNLHFYLRLMRDIRAHIRAGTFADFRAEFAARYQPPKRN